MKMCVLPFAQVRDGATVSLWQVENSGNWGADNALGAVFAQACVDHMQRAENPSLLGHVVAAMMEKTGGKLGGIEVGFLHRVAVLAMIGISDSSGRA